MATIDPVGDVISGDELLARIDKKLTERETEVLGYILNGLSNEQIALAIYRSSKTVDKHCQRIYRKLDVHRRVNLVRLCLEAGYSGGKIDKVVEKRKPGLSQSISEDDSYAIMRRLIQKSRAWDKVSELERILSPVSGPRYFGEFVCAMTRVFGVKCAGISENHQGEPNAVVIAYSEKGVLFEEMEEYEIEGTPCQHSIRDGRYIIPEGASAVFPTDQYLKKTSIESYAGVRLDDRILGTLGLIWICDDKPMQIDDMQLEILDLIASSVGAELAVQVALDRAGET